MQILVPGAGEQEALVLEGRESTHATFCSRIYKNVSKLNIHVFLSVCINTHISIFKVSLSIYVYFSTELLIVVKTVEFSLYLLVEMSTS